MRTRSSFRCLVAPAVLLQAAQVCSSAFRRRPFRRLVYQDVGLSRYARLRRSEHNRRSTPARGAAAGTANGSFWPSCPWQAAQVCSSAFRRSERTRPAIPAVLLVAFLLLAAPVSVAQDLFGVLGDPVAAQVETIYTKGLKYLLATQQKNGAWKDSYGRQPGVIGLAILAMLAHGEDPDFGPCSEAIRKGVEAILDQAKPTGYLGDSMYNHSFATLALAEVYGMVDDDRVGPALQKAVDLILNSQKRNPYGGWRYSPESKDADTTVSGACMVALFAARNAGMAVPQEAIDRGLQYFRSCAAPGGGFGYTSPSGPSGPRSAIGALVFALAGHQEEDVCKASVSFLKARLGQTERSYYHYYLYYMAQAMFRNDMKTWRKWDSINLKRLASSQQDNGSWKGSHGETFCTSAALLSLALNYRFLPIYER